MAVSNIWKTATQLSLGLVIVLIWGFLWIRADVFFPINTELWKFDYILTFIVLISFVFAWDTIRGSQTERALFKISFLKRFPVFIISAIAGLIILVLLNTIINGASFPSIVSSLTGIGLGVLVVHAFLVSIGEELIFRGWVPERLREAGMKPTYVIWVSSVIFAGFHAGMGKSWITLLTYIPLGILFYQVKRRFSPQTNMANAGLHFAWNLFILGFLI